MNVKILGPDSTSRRPRPRTILIAAAAVTVLVAGVTGGFLVKKHHDEEAEKERKAARSAEYAQDARKIMCNVLAGEETLDADKRQWVRDDSTGITRKMVSALASAAESDDNMLSQSSAMEPIADIWPEFQQDCYAIDVVVPDMFTAMQRVQTPSE